LHSEILLGRIVQVWLGLIGHGSERQPAREEQFPGEMRFKAGIGPGTIKESIESRSTTMAKRTNEKLKKSRDYSKAELKEIYAQSRKDFSAADLQKYTVIEKGVPLEKVIAAMEKIQKPHKAKKKA
jgi:hypothetical protein